MGVFFEILSAINNPEQKASINQLSQVTNAIQSLTDERGIDPSMTQSIMSTVGGYMRSALQQKDETGGAGQIGNLVGQLAGGGNQIGSIVGQLAGGNPSFSAIQSFIPPQIQQQMIEGLVQKTGLPTNAIQGMLPTLLPTVFNLLQMGSSKPGVSASNPVLNAFLDSSSEGGADLGNVIKFANRFLNPPK
jgi:uncharacterized protein YidB (DUF937 family)